MAKHSSEAPKAVEDCHVLLAWIIPHLDAFPRARRFTLGERIESGLLEVLKRLIASTRRVTATKLKNVARPALCGVRASVALIPRTPQASSGLQLGFSPAAIGLLAVGLAFAPPVAQARLYRLSPSAAQASRPASPATPADPLPTPARDPAACADAQGERPPEMVVIPPGHFLMGTPDAEVGRFQDEGPRHWVTIRRPFALGRCEVTVGQFRRFVADTHYQTEAERGKGCWVWNAETGKGEQRPDRHWQNPGYAQADNHPVVCVSLADAQAYADWLSKRTGAHYRLPTEAEWEFAVRATPEVDVFRASARYWGEDAHGKGQCAYANGADQRAKTIAGKTWTLADCDDAYAYTALVAYFRPNALGVYDLLGNVWEWTADCWHENYKGAPTDGSAWREQDGGDCGRGVVRGGSWFYDPQILRSGIRLRLNHGAFDGVGFRLARAL